MAGRRGEAGSAGRVCLRDGCGRRVRPGEAFCRGHGRTPEAVAFRRELRGVTAYLERVADEDPARAAALGRLGRRAGRGEFDRVGEARRRVEAERAAAGAAVARRVAAAHLAMVRAVMEERDPGRMAAEVARGAREAARARGRQGPARGGELAASRDAADAVPHGTESTVLADRSPSRTEASTTSDRWPALPNAEDVGLNRRRPAKDPLG